MKNFKKLINKIYNFLNIMIIILFIIKNLLKFRNNKKKFKQTFMKHIQK